MSETRMSEIYHVISTLILIYQFLQHQKRRMRIKFHAKHPLIKFHSMINDDTYFSGYVSACLKNDMDGFQTFICVRSSVVARGDDWVEINSTLWQKWSK